MHRLHRELNEREESTKILVAEVSNNLCSPIFAYEDLTVSQQLSLGTWTCYFKLRHTAINRRGSHRVW